MGMQDKYERGILRISAVFILAGLFLIPLPLIGMGPSLIMLLALPGAAWALYEAWQRAEGRTHCCRRLVDRGYMLYRCRSAPRTTGERETGRRCAAGVEAGSDEAEADQFGRRI